MYYHLGEPPAKSLLEAEIIVGTVYDDIASVRIYSPWWVDFAHVVEARGAWRLLHVTWQRRHDDPS